jgi:hypothetical protein
MSETAELTSVKESEPARQETAAHESGTAETTLAIPGMDGRAAGAPVLRHRANTAIRSVVLRQAQRTYGNRFAQRSVARGLAQRSCNCGGTCEKCSQAAVEPDSEQKHLVQMQATGETSPNGLDAGAVRDVTSTGQSMDPNTRESMEGHFGADFGDIRIHQGASVSKAADAIQADAYTMGRDIYFAEGKYQPQSQEGSKLLAHELTHTEQQAAGQAPSEALASRTGDVVIGAPDDPLEREAEHHAEAYTRNEEHGAVTPDSQGQVRRGVLSSIKGAGKWVWGQTGGRVVRGIERGVEWIEEHVEEWLEEHAPTLMLFLRKGPVEVIRSRIEEGLEGSIGGVLGQVQRNGLFGTLKSLASEGLHVITAMADSLVADACTGMRKLVEGIIAFQRWTQSTIWAGLTAAASAVSSIFGFIWNDLIVPGWNGLKKAAGAVADWVSARAQEFWNFIKPAVDLGARIWNRIKQFIAKWTGIAWDTGASILDWIKEKAKAAWDKVKATIEPILGPLKVIGAVLLLLSPVGPIAAVAAAGYGLFQAAKWLYQNWDHLNIVVKAREVLHNTIIPAIHSAVAAVKSAAKTVVDWLGRQAAALRDALTRLAEALGVFTFLKLVKNAVEWIKAKVVEFADWAISKLAPVAAKIGAILDKIWNFIQPIAVIVAKLMIVVSTPLLWPLYIGAVVWMMLPDCIKPPIIDYLMDLMIAAIRAIPNWGMFGEDWPKIKGKIADTLEQKRRDGTEDEKLKFSNKVASMIAGPELKAFSNLFWAARNMPQYFVPEAEKELIGMDLSEPLPFERRSAPDSTGTAATASVQQGQLAAQDYAILQKTMFGPGDVVADQVPEVEVPGEFYDSFDLPEGGLTFATNPNPTITNESLRAELLAGGGPGGEGATEAMQPPPAELSVEDQIRWFVAHQPVPACDPAPSSAAPTEAKASNPAMQVLRPLTQGQRATYLWEQMRKGLAQWYECHKTGIIASIIGVALAFIILLILTDGVLLEVLPPIMEAVGYAFIGVSMIKMSGYLADYVFEAMNDNPTAAARSLARALAIGAIELIMYLLTAGSGKGGQKAAQKGLEEAAEGAVKTGAKRTRPFLEALGDAGRRLAANVKNPIGALVRNGRVVMRGLEGGFVRGVRSLRELGERILQRLGLKGLSIELHLPFLEVVGHFNTDIVLIRINILRALEDEKTASRAYSVLERAGVLEGYSVASAGGRLTVAQFGERQTAKILAFAMKDSRLAGYLEGSIATKEVVAQTRRLAAEIAQQTGGKVALEDILRQIGALTSKPLEAMSAHAERQLAILLPDAQALGSAFRVCEACQLFFPALTKSRGRGLIIADPARVWLFAANGKVSSYARSVLEPLLADESQVGLRRLQIFLKTGAVPP